ncbi:tensin-4 [Agrilus planipennis]|uniref:Tensin-4 n=1 Tax=Agrilus planipennis TaxID=224129 RepID=A0A1W4WBA4_AGRPL|nr:tensin-4 [Agrilus planipennis]
MAYAAQLQKQPTFQEVIASQLDQYQTEKVNWSKGLTPGLFKDKLSPHNSTRQSPETEMQLNGNSEGSTLRLGPPSTIPGLRPSHKFNVLDFPDKIQSSHPSPPSSDESNSPTELNSCKRMTEKPPLIKRIAMGLTGNHHQHEVDDDSYPLFSRSSPNSTSSSTPNSPPASGRQQCPSGYVNDNGTSVNNSPKITISRTNNDLEKNDDDEEDEEETELSSTTQKNVTDNGRIVLHNSPASTEQEFKSKRISQISSSSSSSCQQSSTENTSISFTPTPPPLPERTDSLFKEEGELRSAPWFQAGIPREITLEVLSQEPVGAFMVRESTTKPGCYALSLRVPRNFQPSGIAHYLIIRTNKGFRIKGFTKEFSTLTSLITHHSVMQELLPCPLSLSRYNPSFVKSDSRKDFADIDMDPDYNTLADFRKMMADLK